MKRVRTLSGDFSDITSARIQGALLSRGITQRAFADVCRVHESTVSRILRAEYPVRSVRSKRTRAAVLRLLETYTGIAIGELEELTTATQAA